MTTGIAAEDRASSDTATAPALSGRALGMLGPGGDDGWGVLYRARRLEAAGETVVNLAVGDHDIHTDPAILDAMDASARAGHLGYTSVAGILPLRQAVAARLSRGGVPIGPEAVQITTGGQGALFTAIMVALDPGQSCLLLDPFYASYEQTVRAASGEPIAVPTRAEDGFQPDVAAIAAALRPDTRAILINTPNNPTGVVYARERLEALGALCRRHGLWLISDEVYESQVFDGAHVSPRDLPGLAGHCLVVGSLSKSHAMTGARLGWLAGPEEAVARGGDLATAMVYGLPGFIQDAGLAALRDHAAVEQAIAARYRARRDAVMESLGNAGAVRAARPAAGMYVLLDIRATGLSGSAFAERLLEETRIAAMPGESFGRAAAGHLRVALVKPEAELSAAIATIRAFAERLA